MASVPQPAPTIPGFHYIAPLGAGGFADVFLYEQDMPRRKVAVKVLHADVMEDGQLEKFTREADALAGLSAHPAILTIYQASVSADGRPYLVLEYCPTSLGDRYRNEYLPVPEVLKTGVRIGSALETSHRAGLLHRDIKPSNLLINQFTTPVLSDFGIAQGHNWADTDEVALSIPWSAPEVISGETSGTTQTEVWSLGATLYALVAGRSPFEVEDGDNSNSALKKRIAKAKYTPTNRPDVPGQLEQVLATALARNPEDRYATVEQLVRALRSVEHSMGLAVTDAQIMQPTSAHQPLDQTTATRGMPVRSVVPQESRRQRPSQRSSRSSRRYSETTASEPTSLTRRQLTALILAVVLITSGTVAGLMFWLGAW